jgi:hypothetical protein
MAVKTIVIQVYAVGMHHYGRKQGRIQDFKLGGGAHLKKLHRAEGGAKFLGYFVWKITILRQKIIFFPIAEGGANIFGVFRVKNHDFTQKNHIFSNFREMKCLYMIGTLTEKSVTFKENMPTRYPQ